MTKGAGEQPMAAVLYNIGLTLPPCLLLMVVPFVTGRVDVPSPTDQRSDR